MKDFLKSNILEILAIGAFIQFIIVILFILYREVKSSDTTTMMILTSSTTICITVLNYYFGSSKGSKDKQEKIDSMSSKTDV